MSCASGEGTGTMDGSPVATYVSGAPAFLAQAEGIISIRSGCLYLAGETGEVFLPVFPASEVAWKDGALTYLNRTYREGDHLVLPGGHMSLSNLKGVFIPASCLAKDAFIVGELE